MIVPPSLCVLAKTACKSFGKTLTADLLDDDVDEHVRLGRQQRAPGIVNRDRSGVGMPLRGPAAPHRAGADPGRLIRRALLDIGAVKSPILERNSLSIGEVFALL